MGLGFENEGDAHVDHVAAGLLCEGLQAAGRGLLQRRHLPREQRLPIARREELQVVRRVRVNPCIP